MPKNKNRSNKQGSASQLSPKGPMAKTRTSGNRAKACAKPDKGKSSPKKKKKKKNKKKSPKKSAVVASPSDASDGSSVAVAALSHVATHLDLAHATDQDEMKLGKTITKIIAKKTNSKKTTTNKASTAKTPKEKGSKKSKGSSGKKPGNKGWTADDKNILVQVTMGPEFTTITGEGFEDQPSGVYKFNVRGHENAVAYIRKIWEKIQRNYLPHRTVKAIMSHFYDKLIADGKKVR